MFKCATGDGRTFDGCLEETSRKDVMEREEKRRELEWSTAKLKTLPGIAVAFNRTCHCRVVDRAISQSG
jgi:hypothetical protein